MEIEKCTTIVVALFIAVEEANEKRRPLEVEETPMVGRRSISNCGEEDKDYRLLPNDC